VSDRFLKACRREPVDATPVWFMRQAGRYMPEYRALRARYSLLEICRQPELAAAVTMQPVEAIDVDAAILFSDLLLPFTPMGLDFDFVKGEGPSIEHPIRRAGDVGRLRGFEPREALAHVLETIRLLRRTLAGRLPLIGFGGAPFTLAAYAIEGGPSTTYARTKAFMFSEPGAWHRLCGFFADRMADYLRAQVEAGVQALQIFDSWAGALSREHYREFALPHTRTIFDALAQTGVPLIHFGVGTAAILADFSEAGGHVVGIDWRLPLDEAWHVIGPGRGVQGNLDPTLLLGTRDRLLASADDVLRRAGGRPGHIFNLGHGVLPDTPLEHVQMLAAHVHEASRRGVNGGDGEKEPRMNADERG
jgi:uroporphyrinogen decarboxylase